MNKSQFLALNIVGGICGLLIICDLVLGILNSRLNAQVAQTQAQFYQAQQILADNLPVIYFVVPRLYVATSTRVVGAIPAPVRPPILWNADAIGVAR